MRKRLFGNSLKRRAIFKGKHRRRAVRYYEKQGFASNTATFFAKVDEMRDVVIKAIRKMAERWF